MELTTLSAEKFSILCKKFRKLASPETIEEILKMEKEIPTLHHESSTRRWSECEGEFFRQEKNTLSKRGEFRKMVSKIFTLHELSETIDAFDYFKEEAETENELALLILKASEIV
jgi:hypothetical protein